MSRRQAAAIKAAVERSKPVLVFLAGPNGAGKSTFFRTYLEPLGLPFVNADEIAAALRAIAGPASIVDLEKRAFTQAEETRRFLLESRRSFCTESVFSDPVGAKLQLLRDARDDGYDLILIFIGIASPQLSLARVMQRVEEGGHDVPDEKLIDRYPRTLRNLQQALPLAHEAFHFRQSPDLLERRFTLAA